MTEQTTWRMVAHLIPNGTRLVHCATSEDDDYCAWVLECPAWHGASETGWIVLAQGATLQECLMEYDQREADVRWWQEQIDGKSCDQADDYGLWHGQQLGDNDERT
jgi:hypothetical protein